LNARLMYLIALNVIVVCLFTDALAQTSTDAGSKTDPINGIEKVGGRVSAPRLVYAPDPEYSAEALDLNYEGFCVLSVVVDPNGRPRDIKVVQELGHGLDEKAVEAVKEWKFEPAMKDGKPVAVQTYVQVQFHRNELSDSDPREHSATRYTQEQVTKLVAKCARYLNTDLDRQGNNHVPPECAEFLAWVWWMKRERPWEQKQSVQLAALAYKRVSHEPDQSAQLNKMPQYTREQLADLRVKCSSSIDTKVEDLESKKAPLPPHEGREVLEWMRNPRVDTLYTTQKPPQ
jgi:TonB family protein